MCFTASPHLVILRNEVTKNLKTFYNMKAGGQAPSGFYDLKTKTKNYFCAAASLRSRRCRTSSLLGWMSPAFVSAHLVATGPKIS